MLPINERFAALNRVEDAKSEALLVNPVSGDPRPDVKSFCRITIPDDDGLLSAYIIRARHYAEEVTNRAILPQRWKLTLQNWPGRDWTNTSSGLGYSNIDAYYRYNFIELPHASPLIAVDTFAYQDSGHVQYSLASPTDYLVDSDREPARVVLPYGQVWPTRVLDTASPIQIGYRAGYLDAQSIPPPIIQAMLMLVAHWYENREAMVVGRTAQIATEIRWAPDELLWPYRIGVVG